MFDFDDDGGDFDLEDMIEADTWYGIFSNSECPKCGEYIEEIEKIAKCPYCGYRF